MVSQAEILKNLGMALYMHRGMTKIAERARNAVEYLARKGVFDGMPMRKTARKRKRGEKR